MTLNDNWFVISAMLYFFSDIYPVFTDSGVNSRVNQDTTFL